MAGLFGWRCHQASALPLKHIGMVQLVVGVGLLFSCSLRDISNGRCLPFQKNAMNGSSILFFTTQACLTKSDICDFLYKFVSRVLLTWTWRCVCAEQLYVRFSLRSSVCLVVHSPVYRWPCLLNGLRTLQLFRLRVVQCWLVRLARCPVDEFCDCLPFHSLNCTIHKRPANSRVYSGSGS